MDFIGYVRDAQNLAHALTYGAQADIEAWADLNKQVDPTTAVFQPPPGTDVPRCMVDDAYFQSLNP